MEFIIKSKRFEDPIVYTQLTDLSLSFCEFCAL